MPWIDMPPAPGARARAEASAAVAGAAPRWYSVRNAADADEAEVMIYDSIGGWFGVYADEFIDELRGITAPKMRVRINSPGGSVFEGIAIANALRAHPATVTVQVDGLAASIASVIAMAGDRVEMAPNSMIMIHEASGVCMGDAAEMDKMSEVLGMISTNIAGAYAARAGGDAATWRAAMQAETWYLPAAAVEAGLADVALDAAPTAPESEPAPEEPDEEDLAARMAAQFDLAAFGYTGPPKPERPKPTPPPVHAAAAGDEPSVSLVIRIDEALDEETVALLRAVVANNASPASPGTDPGESGAAGPDAASPEAPGSADDHTEPADEIPETTDDWAQSIARLTVPQSDPWTADIARLTGPASSRATES